MVRGIENFREWFRGYEDQYVIIGGAACDLLMTEEGLDFRATKDIDLVLIIEAVNAAFSDNAITLPEYAEGLIQSPPSDLEGNLFIKLGKSLFSNDRLRKRTLELVVKEIRILYNKINRTEVNLYEVIRKNNRIAEGK